MEYLSPAGKFFASRFFNADIGRAFAYISGKLSSRRDFQLGSNFIWPRLAPTRRGILQPLRHCPSQSRLFSGGLLVPVAGNIHAMRSDCLLGAGHDARLILYPGRSRR